jgi:hypothetical protein
LLAITYGTLKYGQQCTIDANNNATNNWGCKQGLTSCDVNPPSQNNVVNANSPNPSCWCQIGTESAGKLCCGSGSGNGNNPAPSGYATWDAWCYATMLPASCQSPAVWQVSCGSVEHFCKGSCVGQSNVEEGSGPLSMPVSSATALIFVAFFVGVILSYVVYKFRKNSKKYVQADSVQALSESSRQSAEDSHLGERPLNVAPLSEQV